MSHYEHIHCLLDFQHNSIIEMRIEFYCHFNYLFSAHLHIITIEKPSRFTEQKLNTLFAKHVNWIKLNLQSLDDNDNDDDAQR